MLLWRQIDAGIFSAAVVGARGLWYQYKNICESITKESSLNMIYYDKMDAFILIGLIFTTNFGFSKQEGSGSYFSIDFLIG